MFGRKKEENPKRSRRSGSGGTGLAQFGLIDVPNFEDFDKMDDDIVDDDDDDALEAELLALTSGQAAPRRQKKVAAPVASGVLDKMVADSLRDIPSDESLSGDEDDPTLLEELTGLIDDGGAVESQPPSQERVNQTPSAPNAGLGAMLHERLTMYQQAEANAKAAGESARARRFNRGIKTLTHLLKEFSRGNPIDEAEIPPPVAIQTTKKSPTDEHVAEEESKPEPPPVPPRSAPPPIPKRTAPAPPQDVITVPAVPLTINTDSGQNHSVLDTNHIIAPIHSSDEENGEKLDKEKTLKLLKTRQDEYKLAAVKLKRAGDIEGALRFVKIAKQFDSVISALNEGKPVDLSAMPPPPPDDQLFNKESSQPTPVVSILDKKEEQEKQRSSEEPSHSDVDTVPQPEEVPEEYAVTASTVSEALDQRLKLYQSQEEAARTAGNSSKARRMGRIVKQYQDAIKLHNAGKQIPVDELPTPPGFAPIPVDTPAPTNLASGGISASPKAPAPLPIAPSAPRTSQPADQLPSPSKPTSATTDKETQKINARRGAVERQMSFLTSRQKEFKLAALEAKKKGELNQAKEYLRLAKGFEPLLDAASSGLPIDMNSVPIPPSSKTVLETDFDIISKEDCAVNCESDVYEKLESDLTNQLKMCMQTRNHFKAIADVASANRFEQLALHSKKDLDVVRAAHKRNELVPRFHYETKSFSIVQCNTDLTDNDFELTFVQGVNYNVPNPKEVDTYIKFEFPYPNETPVKDKTGVIYNTNNPEYSATFPLKINRNSKACQRVFKRHSIKCEVWAKGGFFKSDSLIGTVAVKLQPLETKCTLHDSFDLMDGRKVVGGKLEVKIRIRNPIHTKQVEQVQEKWLVIDH